MSGIIIPTFRGKGQRFPGNWASSYILSFCGCITPVMVLCHLDANVLSEPVLRLRAPWSHTPAVVDPGASNQFRHVLSGVKASLVAQSVKNLPAVQETPVQSLDREDPLEEGMATHSSLLSWRIPRTEGPGGLQSTGSRRVRHG